MKRILFRVNPDVIVDGLSFMVYRLDMIDERFTMNVKQFIS